MMQLVALTRWSIGICLNFAACLFRRMNGAPSASSSREDGCTTQFTAQSHTSCCSGKLPFQVERLRLRGCSALGLHMCTTAMLARNVLGTWVRRFQAESFLHV